MNSPQLERAKAVKARAKKLPKPTSTATEIDWEHLDSLTSKERLAAIKKYNVQITEGEQADEAKQVSIREAIAEAKSATKKLTADFWRIGKLLIFEKPRHKGTWQEWYESQGLDKDRVSRATTIAHRYKTAEEAAKVTVRAGSAPRKQQKPSAVVGNRIKSICEWLDSDRTSRLLIESKGAVEIALLEQALRTFSERVAQAKAGTLTLSGRPATKRPVAKSHLKEKAQEIVAAKQR